RRRTSQPVNGQPVQVIGPTPGSHLPLVDLTELAEAARETVAHGLVTEEARYSFDLCAGPVWRATLVRLAPLDHILMLTFHHIVSDAWSMGVFIREVISIYEAFSRNERSPLAGLPIQYADFAHWQRERLKGPGLESLLSYWKQQLGDKVQVLELPTDRPRPAVPRYEGGQEEFRLSKKTHDALKALSQQENASLFMTILAAFQLLLFRYTDQEDITVGTPIANRNRAEIEGLIGFFVNTLVMRGDLSGDPTFRQLLARVREAALGAYTHQDLPFELLVKELQPER